MTVDGQRTAYAALHQLAHEICGGRWVALGGGGYEPVQVVPRAWTSLLAEATGGPVDGDTPEDWRDLASRKGGEHAPLRLTDDRSVSFVPWDGPRPGDAVDRAVQETRDAVFPALGLDP